MKITKIKKSKTTDIYTILFDNDEKIKVHEDILIKFSLYNAKSITDEDYKKLKVACNENNAYHKALNYISYRMRSISEIEKYLYKNEYSKTVRNKVTERLKSENYLNDLEFAKAYVQTKINTTDKGPLIIRKELLNYQVEDKLIGQALLLFDKDIEAEKVDKFIKKKAKINKKLTIKALKIKLRNDLIGKGYNSEIINEIISNTELNVDNDLEESLLHKHLTKAKTKYSKKYSDYELKQKVIAYLVSKGYEYSKIVEMYDTIN